MILLEILPGIVWMLLAVSAYRLGLADGISTARRGRLAGKRAAKEEDPLLKRIEAFNGRKDCYDANE